jgi:hypothetical protein
MGGTEPPLPQYPFMAWCSVRGSIGATLPLPYLTYVDFKNEKLKELFFMHTNLRRGYKYSISRDIKFRNHCFRQSVFENRVLRRIFGLQHQNIIKVIKLWLMRLAEDVARMAETKNAYISF